MRTSPTPCVSENTTLAAFPQAFMCSRIRERRERDGLSMKDTLKRAPVRGHLRPTTTAIRRWPPRRPGGVRTTLRCSAAFSGLISTERLAAATSLSSGRLFGLQRISAIYPSPPASLHTNDRIWHAMFTRSRTNGRAIQPYSCRVELHHLGSASDARNQYSIGSRVGKATLDVGISEFQWTL